jgi:hypothetical protein
MAIDVNKVSEGVHYELIPMEEDSQAWAIRILEGAFSETVIKFGNVEFDGRGDDTIMKYNFFIVSTPDDDLTEEDTYLQKWAGDILQDVIANGIETGATMFKDKESKFYLAEPE